MEFNKLSECGLWKFLMGFQLYVTSTVQYLRDTVLFPACVMLVNLKLSEVQLEE